MSRFKKILLGLLILFISIQFFQPARNNTDGQVLPENFVNTYSVPENVQAIVKTACYDCHSNHTNYPWYSYIQPVGWILDKHIRDGKEELNFSEFGAYSVRRQMSKLKAIGGSIRDATMPLSSYTMLHESARLSQDDKKLILEWTRRTMDSLGAKN